jgi:titin
MAPRHPVRRPRHRYLGIESLEMRSLLATYYVDNTLGVVGSTADLGNLSLAGAITLADLQPGSTIVVDEGPSLATIHLSVPLPAITAPTTIIGKTIGGAPAVDVDGSALLGVGNTGFDIKSAGVTISNLAIDGFSGPGVEIDGPATGAVLSGNYIGVALDGSTAAGNGGPGVLINGSANDLIGTSPAGAGNIISGNVGGGVVIQGAGSTGDIILGNRIGTDATGEVPIGNAFGVSATGAAGLVVRGNTISGNTGDGIALASGSKNIIDGNKIGTDAAGGAGLGNRGAGGVVITGESQDIVGDVFPNVISANSGNGVVFNGVVNSYILHDVIGLSAGEAAALGNKADGILVEGASSNNVIGPASAGAGNVISGNALNGVRILASASGTAIYGNLIGTDGSGAAGLGNGGSGIFIDGASRTNVGGGPGALNVISGNSVAGVWVGFGGGSNNVVQGNLIGTNLAGTAAIGNGYGVVVDGATGTLVGGSAAAANVLSGNAFGVNVIGPGSAATTVADNIIGLGADGTTSVPNVEGVQVYQQPGVGITGNVISANLANGVYLAGGTDGGTVVSGNKIGTDFAGMAARPNGNAGVMIDSTAGVVVGGTDFTKRNLISGNAANGVRITGASSAGNVVEGNWIGVDATGSAPLGNGVDGLLVVDGAHANMIGGPAQGAGNVIAASGSTGVHIALGATGNALQGNLIGLNATGQALVGHQVYGIFVDGAPGNQIGGAGPAANYVTGDTDVDVDLFGTGSSGNAVVGNFIGLDGTGESALGSAPFGLVVDDAPGNLIGGTSPGLGNTFGGHSHVAIDISGSNAMNNVVVGNLVGPGPGDSPTMANNYSIVLADAPDEIVGGSGPGAANVLRGNQVNQVTVFGPHATGEQIGTNQVG